MAEKEFDEKVELENENAETENKENETKEVKMEGKNEKKAD